MADKTATPSPASPTARQPRRSAKRRVSFEAWLNDPAERFSEWVDGEVIEMSVTPPHQLLAQFLYKLMDTFAETNNLGTVLTAPCAMRVSQRPSGREPDVMFIAKENAHRIVEKFVDGPADVVVEIISDDSVTRDRRDKFYEYALAGVREYWMVDYRQKRAEFYRLNEYGTYDLIALEEGGVFRSEALPGFWLKVEWLWQEPLPKLLTVLREWGLV